MFFKIIISLISIARSTSNNIDDISHTQDEKRIDIMAKVLLEAVAEKHKKALSIIEVFETEFQLALEYYQTKTNVDLYHLSQIPIIESNIRRYTSKLKALASFDPEHVASFYLQLDNVSRSRIRTSIANHQERYNQLLVDLEEYKVCSKFYISISKRIASSNFKTKENGKMVRVEPGLLILEKNSKEKVIENLGVISSRIQTYFDKTKILFDLLKSIDVFTNLYN